MDLTAYDTLHGHDPQLEGGVWCCLGTAPSVACCRGGPQANGSQSCSVGYYSRAPKDGDNPLKAISHKCISRGKIGHVHSDGRHHGSMTSILGFKQHP